MPDLFSSGMFSNNAPPPIPGGFGNPTGINSGAIQSKGTFSTGFPAFSQFGPVTQNSSAFGPNTGTFSGDKGSPMAGLSSALPGAGAIPGSKDDNLGHELVSAYGEGTGNLILQMLHKGLFNPQVASAMMNALQPGIARGQADILNAFGEGGSRYSSSAGIGLGDFNSQVNLNEGQIMAGLFQHSQDQELSLLQNILPTLHAEKANKKGIFGSILGGLEIAGGLIGAPFTGGASLGLVGSGVSQLTGGGAGGSSTGSGIDMKALGSLFGQGDSGGSGSSFDISNLASAPQGSMDSTIQQIVQMQQQNQLAASGGSIWDQSGDPRSTIPSY